jgi:hypothetical protein
LPRGEREGPSALRRGLRLNSDRRPARAGHDGTLPAAGIFSRNYQILRFALLQRMRPIRPM